MGYDRKCGELAEHFLEETFKEIDLVGKPLLKIQQEEVTTKLAQHIQDEIEGWIEYTMPDLLR